MDTQGHILLVEDDAIIQNLIATILDSAGYGVVCAKDGEAGWDALSGSRFDLLITDNNMPNLSGLGLVRRLRAAQFTLPVLLISGEIPHHVKDLETLVTPGGILEKPFSMSKLLAHVRSLLVFAEASS